VSGFGRGTSNCVLGKLKRYNAVIQASVEVKNLMNTKEIKKEKP